MKKFPTYRQLDSMDCGPTCLRIIASHYGRSWSLLGISDAAEAVGFRTMGVKLTFGQLCEEAVLPASGLLRYTREQFLKSWISIREDNAEGSDAKTEGLGIALLLEPTPKFYEEKGEEDRRRRGGFKVVFSNIFDKNLKIKKKIFNLQAETTDYGKRITYNQRSGTDKRRQTRARLSLKPCSQSANLV